MKRYKTQQEAWEDNLKYTSFEEALPTINWNDWKWEIGDHVVFQKITEKTISRPISGIFVGWEMIDMAVGFNFIEKERAWMNSCEVLTNVYQEKEYYCDYDCLPPYIHEIIEWDDKIKILGTWKQKPTLKQLLFAITPEKDKWKRF